MWADVQQPRNGEGPQKYKRAVVQLSIGFFGLFMAYSVGQALATTLLHDLGSLGLAILYVMFTISCIPAPTLVNKIGPKLCMVFGACPYILMILSFLQHTPSPYIIYPCYGLVGVGAAILWTGQGVFLGRCAMHAASVSSMSVDAMTSTFNALFFTSFQLNAGSGTLLAGVLLNKLHSHNVLFILMSGIAGLGLLVLMFLPRVPPATSLATDGSSASLYETLSMFIREPRMRWTIPVIFYNGLSLGFFLGYYPAQVVNPLLGAAFVGFVCACFYLSNTLFTYVNGALTKTCCGRTGVVLAAVVAHAVFFVLLIFWDSSSSTRSYTMEQDINFTGSAVDTWSWDGDLAFCRVSCNANFTCAGFIRPDNVTDDTVAACVGYNVSHYTNTSGVSAYIKPSVEAYSYAIVFAMAVLFAYGDSIWESQIPALLQSAYAYSTKEVECSMANIKLWQSLGFGVQFGLQRAMGSLSNSAVDDADLFQYNVIGLGCMLLLSAAGLLYLHCKGHPLDLYENLDSSEDDDIHDPLVSY